MSLKERVRSLGVAIRLADGREKGDLEELLDRNITINNAGDANRLIKDIIQTKTQNIFKQEKSKTHNYEIRLKNGETTLYLNTNIWGESTDYWRKLREYLEKDNEYFKIESLR